MTENINITPETTPINITPPNILPNTPPVPIAPSNYYTPYQGSRIDVQRFDSRDRQLLELDKCLRRLKKKCEKDNTIKELKDRQYYKKPSEIKREKIKNAKRLMEKNRKKAELYNNTSYFSKRKEKESGSRFGTNSTTRTNEDSAS